MLESPRVPYSVVALTVVAAVAACAVFLAALDPAVLGSVGALPVIVAGVILIAALAALWVIQRRRDRTLW
jgi:hypothetical protein